MEKDSLTVHIHVLKYDRPIEDDFNDRPGVINKKCIEKTVDTPYSYALEIDEDAYKKLAAGKASVIAYFYDKCECVGIFKFVNDAHRDEIITFCPDQAQPVSGAVPAYRCKQGLSAEPSKTGNK